MKNANGHRILVDGLRRRRKDFTHRTEKPAHHSFFHTPSLKQRHLQRPVDGHSGSVKIAPERFEEHSVFQGCFLGPQMLLFIPIGQGMVSDHILNQRNRAVFSLSGGSKSHPMASYCLKSGRFTVKATSRWAFFMGPLPAQDSASMTTPCCAAAARTDSSAVSKSKVCTERVMSASTSDPQTCSSALRWVER